MNNKLMCCIFALLTVSVAFSVVLIDYSESDTAFENSDEYRSIASTNIPIMILSENPTEMVKKLSFGTDKISNSADFPVIVDEKAVFIDDSWLSSKNIRAVNTYISGLLNQGIIIVSMGSADVFMKNPNIEFKAFMEDCDTYSIHKASDGSSFVCYSIDDGGLGNALLKTYCWVKDRIGEARTVQNSGILDLPWGTEYSSNASVYHEDYGCMNIATNYFVIPEENPRYNYYYTHYYQESVPDNNRYTADMYTRTQNTQSNLSYLYHAPTTSSGSSTVNIGFGVEVGLPDLVGVNSSISWSYSIPDVVVHDRSNTGTGLIDIWHDVDENKIVGSDTYYIEPAKLMKIDCQNGAGYCYQRDEYSIQFCKKVFLWKEYSTVDKTLNVYFVGLPHTLTIDSNGADGCIYDGEPDYFEEININTYSEGTYVRLTDHGYYKNGYTLAGFSVNPNSTTIDYALDSSIQLMNDTTLYIVWV